VKVTNPTHHIAFFVQLALTRDSNGAEILPVVWDDNYISLLPGESRDITARFAATAAGSAKPVLNVGGWNIETHFDCLALELSPKEIRVGEAGTVRGILGGTFLDGSRVFLRVDGESAAAGWAWAREGKTQTLTFPVRFERSGQHEIALGERRIEVNVQP
jgi:hypothetical protein